MPRVTSVQKARKSPGSCGKCHKVIQIGESYCWWKFRSGGSHVRCSNPLCHPRSSDLTSSDKKSTLFRIQEDIQDYTIDISEGDLKSLEVFRERPPFNRQDIVNLVTEIVDGWKSDLSSFLEDKANEARDVASEYSDALSSLPDSLQSSQTGENLQEAADNIEQWADSMESSSGDAESFEIEESVWEDLKKGETDAVDILNDASEALSGFCGDADSNFPDLPF